MSNQLAPLSASVTRILSLVGFPKELKTKDIQAAFSDWENAQGGFRIKWIDDTSLMIVFADAGVAKRAYLQALANPPPSIFGAHSTAVISPYNGNDAQSIIANVNARHNGSASRGHNARASMSLPNGHNRIASMSMRNGNGNGNSNGFNGRPLNGSIAEHGPQVSIPQQNGVNPLQHMQMGREPSPTLPTIPQHPTLNAMIQQSSPTFAEEAVLNDPAILATSADDGAAVGPRIGDPGKRMLGAALGMRHPGLGPRSLSGGVQMGSLGGSTDLAMQKAMSGLVVSD